MYIREDYVSSEVAGLLKEKGFNGCSWKYYAEPTILRNFRLLDCNYDNIPYKDALIAPTLQMAMKWLRDVYGIFIEVHIIGHSTAYMDNKYYFYKLYKDRQPLKLVEATFMTYEETVEAALKYCLENLI